MAEPSNEQIIEALLDRHGRTYASEAGIRLDRNTPAPLFQLLALSLLLSARISAGTSVQAFVALRDAGWTTPDKMAGSAWSDRARVLNEAGYARYDERTARMLGETADMVCDTYRGDLRKLRDAAARDPEQERSLLQEFTGIGAVGAAVFGREVQSVWDEQYPFADDRALESADRLGLGSDVRALQGNTDGAEQFTLLVAALVRCGLAGDHDEIIEQAAGA